MSDGLDQPRIDGLPFLAADVSERTGCGYPCMPLGAPMACVLRTRKPKHYLRNPDWFDRDRLAGRCRDTRPTGGPWC